jgi:hypothetical protein
MAATHTSAFHDWMRALAERLRPGAPVQGREERVRLRSGASRQEREERVRLATGDTWGLHVHGGEALALTCEDGQLWLTCEGDSRDHVLHPGQTVRLGRPGHVVVQALRPARFCLARGTQGPSRAAPAHGTEAHAP